MIDYCKLLREFHNAIYEKTNSKINVADQEFVAGNATARLRAALIAEEAQEACDELEDGTKANLLKELCDVLYVVYGTAVVYNLPIEQAFIDVHENNMLKIRNGSVGPNGKFLKHPQHPKVDFTKLLEDA